jgi:hypothetical protein
MTNERPSDDDDRTLDEALRELPVPELPSALRLRLQAIPQRGNVRRLPVRSLRVSALGWAAAAALGLFIGAQSIEREMADAGATVSGASDSAEAARVDADEDETLALAIGSFAELEEEP